MSNNLTDASKPMTKEQLEQWIQNREDELQKLFLPLYGKPLRDFSEWEDAQEQQAQDCEED